MMKIYFFSVLVSKLALVPQVASALSERQLFNEREFRSRVSKALESMETILENTRKPVLPEEVEHTYQDKYALVEFVANSGIASYTNALKFVGIDNDTMEKALRWVHESNQTVSLEFDGNMYSELVKEEEGEVTTSTTKKVIESETITTHDNNCESTTETVKVKQPKWDYHYNLHMDFSLIVKSRDEEIKLMDATGSIPFVKTSYYHKQNGNARYHNERFKKDLNLTWLLRMVNGNMSQFTIDRDHESCKTPSRNNNVKKLLEFRSEIFYFAIGLKTFIQRVHKTHQMYDVGATTLNDSLPQISKGEIFIPIVPVFENSTTLSTEDLNELLKLQMKTLDSTTATAIDKYKDSKFTTSSGIILHLISDYIVSLSEQLFDSIEYIEYLLELKLIEAIGKRIDSNDFEKFMKQHNQKFFGRDYAPLPFSRAVQIPGRYPDGVISIESSDMSDDSEPIETLVRKIPAGSNRSMTIPIDAATTVELLGDQYLHGWIQHVWEQSNHGTKDHNLIARAHQFSSYLLVIGVLGGSETFIPKEALILKDKDEVIIPLLSEILPSAKEFKNAIASLSPEQQEFAKAFRAMQLESSVFGICVIPLKPQMENLLNLPEGALTKEIQLMQDLMSLFVEYQIPSDLLSFDGPKDIAAGDRVEAVKGHVSAVLQVIEGEKKKQLVEAKDRVKMAHSEQRINQGSAGSRAHRGRMHSEPMIQLMSSDFGEDEMFYSTAAFAMPSTEPSSAPIQKRDNAEVTQANFREDDDSEQGGTSNSDDFTFIPKVLDAKLEEQNEGALKSTIIKAGENWERLRKDNLLLPPKRSYLDSNAKKTEKNEAMDLLKAISRSGSLPIANSDLHIIISLSHCFHKNLMSTIIQDNINPIKQVEKSLLVVGSVIHSIAPPMLLSLEEGKKRETTKDAEILEATVA
mmetsp:Transcript_24736/g.36945  ORF Transcript_24736/g.36945 Transcript_24736/m.36945 type:complete len:916 (+) Transcript_24736:133-2880(+)